MQRRRYLTACAGAATIGTWVGRVGADDDETDTCPPVFDDIGDGEPDVELGEHDLTVEENFLTETFIEATVENVGDGHSGRIDLEVNWYDEDGNYLGDDRTWLRTLGPEETWATQIRYLGGDDEAIADYEIDLEFDSDPPTAVDDLVLEESEIHVAEDEVTVEGLLANETGNEASYIEAVAIIYDEECVVLGSERTNETDVADGETWAFNMTWRDRRRAEEAVTHRILIADSVF